jgi:hypothetical protein
MQKATLILKSLVWFYLIVAAQVVLCQGAIGVELPNSPIFEDGAFNNVSQEGISVIYLTIDSRSKSWKVTEVKECKARTRPESGSVEEALSRTEIPLDSLFEKENAYATPRKFIVVNKTSICSNLDKQNLEQASYKSLSSKDVAKNPSSVSSIAENKKVSNAAKQKRGASQVKLSFAEKIKFQVARKIQSVVGKRINFIPFLSSDYSHSVEGPLQTSGMAIASLVMGILGWLLFVVPILPLICFILAIVFGGIGLGETSGGKKSGRGLAIAGLVLGILGLLLTLLALALALAILATL